MTYIVGLKRAGQTCIVADTAITTVGVGVAHDPILLGAVKTGQIFPGCLYALSGNARAAQRFVCDCKQALSDEHNLQQSWPEFLDFTKTYDYPAGEDFEAIVCSRATNTSRLFWFSPKQGLVESDDVVTIGMGKSLLDRALDDYLPLLADMIVRSPREHAALVAGIGISLLLTQQCQGDEFSSLERVGVGGIFHFTFQTPEQDCRQPPTVLLLTRYDAARGGFVYWAFRIAWVRRALVVHNAAERTVACLIDMPAMTEFASLGPDELATYSEEVCREALEYPVYELLGVGSADSATRFANFFKIGGGTELDWSFNVSEAIKRLIMRSYDLRMDDLSDIPMIIATAN